MLWIQGFSPGAGFAPWHTARAGPGPAGRWRCSGPPAAHTAVAGVLPVAGEPAQTPAGGQTRIQGPVGQAVEMQAIGPGGRIIVEQADGRAPEVDTALGPHIGPEEKLLSPQALSVNCRARRVGDQRAVEGDLSSDSCPGELDLAVRRHMPAEHVCGDVT